MLIKEILNDVSEIQKYHHATLIIIKCKKTSQVPLKTNNNHYSDHHLPHHHLQILYIIKYHDYQSQVTSFKDNKR